MYFFIGEISQQLARQNTYNCFLCKNSIWINMMEIYKREKGRREKGEKVRFEISHQNC